MTPNLNSEQLAALTDLAHGVKQDYASLEITEILNRIHYITGRDFKQCIAGFKLMFSVGLFPSDFILRAHLLPKIEAMIDKTFPLIVAMEGELVKVDEMNEGPKDDVDEIAEQQSIGAPETQTLFNLDSNF